MTIDTSREAVERMANDLRRAGHSGNFGILPVALALLAERDEYRDQIAELLPAANREAPAQEPVAWRAKDPKHEGGWVYFTYGPVNGQPLYTTPPDHLALVAAAYRDAADAVPVDQYPGSWITPMFSAARDRILARTPADAEAHLTALLRAAYERGVRDALTEAIKEAKGSVYIGGQRFLTAKLDDLEPAFLALLTQEGR